MNPFTLDFHKYKSIILDAIIEVYGKEFSSLIQKRYEAIYYVPYVNYQGIEDYYRFLINCKSKELTIKFLKIVGIDTSKYKITSYADELPTDLKEKAKNIFGGDHIFEPLFRNAPDSFKAFIPKYNKDYTEDYIIENKLKFINEIKRLGTPTITEHNLEEFIKTEEYKRIESMAFYCNGIYDTLLEQMDEYIETIKQYDEYYQKELQRKRKIQEQKKIKLFTVLEDCLRGKIKKHIDSLDSIERKTNELLSSPLEHPSNIEYFNSNYESMLQDPNVEEQTKDWIQRMRMKFFKTMGADIEPWGDKYEDIIKRKDVNELIVYSVFADEVTRLRKYYLEEANKEHILTSDAFKDAMKYFKDDEHNREAVYNIFEKTQVCTSTGANDKYDFNSIIYYTIISWQCGCMDFVVLHEIIHAIETAQIKKTQQHRCGFEINVDEPEMSPYPHKNPKRKYERLNEVITDMLAIEVIELLHRRKIYFLDDEMKTLTEIDNFNTRRVVKLAVSKFFNLYRHHIIEARIYGDISYLTNKIGVENFEEFNRIIDHLDYLTEQGLEERLKENLLYDDMVIMYNHILEQLDELYKKMDEEYKSNITSSNPFGFIKRKFQKN